MFHLRLLSRLPVQVSSSSLSPSQWKPLASASVSMVRLLSVEAVPMPEPEATPASKKTYQQKIVKIVDDISNLTLIEVADLNELLKTRLNISDAPVMMASGFAGGPGAAAPAEPQEEEVEAPVSVQSAFTLKLESFDATKKVGLIKEIKNLVEGMNLVQAKKFVESCPVIVKADLSKDEATTLQKALEAAGAKCIIE